MSDFIKSKYMDFYLFAGYKNDYVHKKYIEQGGTFDPYLAQWMIKNIKTGWTIYDIGANIFEFTEIAARMSGKSGVVRSFEPQIHLIDKYIEAKKNNDYSSAANIEIYPFGLGKENSIKQMKINANNFGAATFSENFYQYSNARFPSQWNLENFEIRRFDSLEILDEVPDLIKIDIEGGEEDAWAGATENFKKSKRIIIEMGPYSSIEFFNEISYNRYAYDIKTMRPITFDQIKKHVQYDVLLINKDESI